MSNHDIIRASDWVSVSELAKRAGVSRQAIHQLITSGRFRVMRFGARSTMVHRKDADAYIQSKRIKKAG